MTAQVGMKKLKELAPDLPACRTGYWHKQKQVLRSSWRQSSLLAFRGSIGETDVADFMEHAITKGVSGRHSASGSSTKKLASMSSTQGYEYSPPTDA